VVKGLLNKKCKEKSRSFDIPNKIREDGWVCSRTRRLVRQGGDQKTSLDAKLLKMPAVTTRTGDGK